MTKLPTGRFIPGSSPLHLLDARIKLLCLFILLAVVIGAVSAGGYAMALAVTVAAVALSGLPLRVTLCPLTRVWSFFLVIFLMNALFFGGDGPTAAWWIFRLSWAGVMQGLHVVAHTALILVLGSVLTLTTSPTEITAALEWMLRPLAWLRVPVGDVAMIISAAMQFIPVLAEEADAIRMAQTARGAAFEGRRMSERAAAMLPLAVPIFLAAFRRADELALAMEARGYRGAGSRKARSPRPLPGRDCTAAAVCAAVCAIQYALI